MALGAKLRRQCLQRRRRVPRVADRALANGANQFALTMRRLLLIESRVPSWHHAAREALTLSLLFFWSHFVFPGFFKQLIKRRTTPKNVPKSFDAFFPCDHVRHFSSNEFELFGRKGEYLPPRLPRSRYRACSWE